MWFWYLWLCICPTPGLHSPSDRVQRLQAALHEGMHPHSQPRHRRIPPGEAKQQHCCEEDQVNAPHCMCLKRTRGVFVLVGLLANSGWLTFFFIGQKQHHVLMPHEKSPRMHFFMPAKQPTISNESIDEGRGSFEIYWLSGKLSGLKQCIQVLYIIVTWYIYMVHRQPTEKVLLSQIQIRHDIVLKGLSGVNQPVSLLSEAVHGY